MYFINLFTMKCWLLVVIQIMALSVAMKIALMSHDDLKYILYNAVSCAINHVFLVLMS